MNPLERLRRGGLLAALVTVALWTLAAGDGPHVASLAGSVEIGSGSPPVWRVASLGDPIAPGDAIRTGHDGRAELVLGTGTVRLYADSLLRLPELASGDDASERVRLERGRSLFDVLKRRNGRFEVETPEVVVSVKGTRFAVDVRSVLAQVAVYRGLVGVRELSETLAAETLVREGFAAVGGADTPFELLLNGAADPWDGFGGGRLMPLIQDRARPQATIGEPVDGALAVHEARAAAREVAHTEAIGIVMDRDPALRARVKKRLAAADVRSAVEPGSGAGRPSDVLQVETEAALSAPADLAAGRDAVADSKPLRKEVQSALIESVVSGSPVGGGAGGGAGGGGGGPGLPVQIDFLSGSGMSGGDAIQVTAAGTAYLFDDDEVEDILEGSATLPLTLQVFLVTNGVTGPALQDMLEQMALLFELN